MLLSIVFLGGYLLGFDVIYLFDLINNIWAYIFDIDWTNSIEYY